MIKILSDSHMNSNKQHIVKVSIVLILIFTISYTVYLTGGTAAALTHLMYIPIVISAYYFGIIGAVGAAVLGGLALGPLMPLDVLLGLKQEAASWIFRLSAFNIIGITISILFKRIRKYSNAELESSYKNVLTGLPNMNKLKLDLDEMLDQKAEFSLIGFRIINSDNINRYSNYDVGSSAINKIAEQLASCLNKTVYSIFNNELAVVLPDSGIEDTQVIMTNILKMIKEPLSIDEFNIEVLIKIGIVNCPLHAKDSNHLIMKMGIALDQGKEEIGIYVYDASIEQNNKKKFEILPHIFSSIKNEEFHLVYQPIMRIVDNSVTEVEALLRWDRSIEWQMNTAELIQIAEEIGIINEITKWVINNVIDQTRKWQNEGMPIKSAINISSKDLRDHSIINYLIESMVKSELEPSMIKIEITERGVLENFDNVMQLFNILKEQEIEISLDDFGTGYNSLVDLVEISTKYLKIDKIFIDKLSNDTNKILIKTIISFAHKTGKKVIAEGVETEKQFNILMNLGCDYIQGYYLSKPLPPEELKKFVVSRLIDA